MLFHLRIEFLQLLVNIVAMADRGDIEATKRARREFTKHHIDISRADLRVMHGVVYLRGIVLKEHGAHYEDVKTETERIGRLLRQLPQVRDVVIDVMYR